MHDPTQAYVLDYNFERHPGAFQSSVFDHNWRRYTNVTGHPLTLWLKHLFAG